MGYTLGYGILWQKDKLNLLNNYQPSTSCTNNVDFTTKPLFLGKNAMAEYGKLGGTAGVPVEEKIRGNKCFKWSENIFDNELMTAFYEAEGKPSFLSRMTVASMKDIGYEVDLSQAEPYSIPKCSPKCASDITTANYQVEMMALDSKAVTVDGRILSEDPRRLRNAK